MMAIIRAVVACFKSPLHVLLAGLALFALILYHTRPTGFLVFTGNRTRVYVPNVKIIEKLNTTNSTVNVRARREVIRSTADQIYFSTHRRWPNASATLMDDNETSLLFNETDIQFESPAIGLQDLWLKLQTNDEANRNRTQFETNEEFMNRTEEVWTGLPSQSTRERRDYSGDNEWPNLAFRENAAKLGFECITIGEALPAYTHFLHLITSSWRPFEKMSDIRRRLSSMCATLNLEKWDSYKNLSYMSMDGRNLTNGREIGLEFLHRCQNYSASIQSFAEKKVNEVLPLETMHRRNKRSILSVIGRGLVALMNTGMVIGGIYVGINQVKMDRKVEALMAMEVEANDDTWMLAGDLIGMSKLDSSHRLKVEKAIGNLHGFQETFSRQIAEAFMVLTNSQTGDAL